MSDPKKVVAKYADAAMFTAEPMEQTTPKVYLLSMSADPLGEIASSAKMYKGEVVRSMAEITDEERLKYFDDLTKTTLNAAFETVKFHFMIEGVTRAFTHQLVRQRTAVYFQESMRFATIDETFADRVGLPPSLVGTVSRDDDQDAAEFDESAGLIHDYTPAQQNRNQWDRAVDEIEHAYKTLVENGMPAEEARGLLPTNILTRIHYVTDLRNLVGHAGLRLCTQAQFEWRHVFSQIARSIREAHTHVSGINFPGVPAELDVPVHMADKISDRLFRPICYQTGKCEFMASFDRACTIRDKVQANHAIGRPSSEWETPHDPKIQGHPELEGPGGPQFIGAIRPAEWLMDDGAARS